MSIFCSFAAEIVPNNYLTLQIMKFDDLEKDLLVGLVSHHIAKLCTRHYVLVNTSADKAVIGRLDNHITTYQILLDKLLNS